MNVDGRTVSHVVPRSTPPWFLSQPCILHAVELQSQGWVGAPVGRGVGFHVGLEVLGFAVGTICASIRTHTHA